MVKSCIAPGCRNTEKDKKDKSIHFHRLPITKPLLLMKWIAKMKLKNPSISKCRYSRICSSHFTPDCFERDLQAELLGTKPKHRLKEQAVPTIFDFSYDDVTIPDLLVTSEKTSRAESEIMDCVKRRNLNNKINHVSLFFILFILETNINQKLCFFLTTPT